MPFYKTRLYPSERNSFHASKWCSENWYRIDHLFSVDAIQIYKPRKEVYQMAVDRLNLPVEKLLFFSSNQWDVSGASVFGMDAVWVNQYDETQENLPFGNVLEMKSLRDVLMI